MFFILLLSSPPSRKKQNKQKKRMEKNPGEKKTRAKRQNSLKQMGKFSWCSVCGRGCHTRYSLIYHASPNINIRWGTILLPHNWYLSQLVCTSTHHPHLHVKNAGWLSACAPCYHSLKFLLEPLHKAFEVSHFLPGCFFLSKSLCSEIGTARIRFRLPSPALRWWRWACMCATDTARPRAGAELCLPVAVLIRALGSCALLNGLTVPDAPEESYIPNSLLPQQEARRGGWQSLPPSKE